MPKKNNPGCKCCNPPCPDVSCKLTSNDTLFTTTIEGSVSSVINEITSGGVILNHPLTPPNGTHSIPYTVGRVYEVVVTGAAPDNCVKTCRLGGQCGCSNPSIPGGLSPLFYVKLDLEHFPGTSGKPNMSGTYIRPLWIPQFSQCLIYIVTMSYLGSGGPEMGDGDIQIDNSLGGIQLRRNYDGPATGLGFFYVEGTSTLANPKQCGIGNDPPYIMQHFIGITGEYWRITDIEFF